MTPQKNAVALALLATLTLGASPAAAAGTGAGTGAIAAHPDKLVFAPFTYVPPSGKALRVVLPGSKVPAFLAVDHELPLVNIVVYIRTGSYAEPPGKEGLAMLTGTLMARGGVEGRKPYSAEDLDERLAYLAAQVNSAIGETSGQVSLNLLSKDLDEGLGILRDVLAAPRFALNKLTLRKQQLLNEMKQRNDDSADIEARERDVLAFGADHFTNRFVTKASIDGVTRADLVAFHHRWVDPRNFVVAASGDFDREQMIRKLDALLQGWPYKGEVMTQGIPKPRTGPAPGLYLVDKQDVTQGRVSVVLPGIQRDDPDYFAIQLMNEILGGGGFTSRITSRVRSDEGLAYHAGSRFTGGVYYPDVFLAQFQSKLRSCSYATAIVLEEMQKLRDKGVTERELSTAKRQLIEGLPQRFQTKAQTVAIYATEELTGRFARDPDYYQRLQERIEKVTQEQVAQAAKKWLSPKAVTILAVGKKQDLLNPDPRHPVPFASLAGGKLVELPMRDPLTMQPLPPPATRPASAAGR